jgi:hypothetical protein
MAFGLRADWLLDVAERREVEPGMTVTAGARSSAETLLPWARAELRVVAHVASDKRSLLDLAPALFGEGSVGGFDMEPWGCFGVAVSMTGWMSK